MGPLNIPGSVFHVEKDGPSALTLLLRVLAKMPHTNVLRAELRDDETSLVSVQVEDGTLAGRIDIGLYPQKGGTYALFKDVSLSRFDLQVSDPSDIERFQSEVAWRIRSEMDFLCHGEDNKICTF